MEQTVEDKLIKTNKLSLSPQIILTQNTIEFTVCAINECFKKEFGKGIIISEEAYLDPITKYYLNSLLMPFDSEEKPVTIIKFSETTKFKFEVMQADKNLSDEFCRKVEKLFKEKYQNKYTFEIFALKKGSVELLTHTNLPAELFEEFVNHINANAEADLGAAQEVRQQRNLTELRFTANMIDIRGNMDFRNLEETQRRGGLLYYQPKGWVRVGLRVMGKYGEDNDRWLAMDGNPDEWAIGFHGLKDISKTNLIVNGNVISKDNWAHGCQTHQNLNVNTQNQFPTCGKGVYFGDKIDVCEYGEFTGSCTFAGKIVKLAFQCRLNPRQIRITNYSPSQAYIVPNQRNDNYDNIRPYGILLKF